ncbi:MAG: hypothetical protein P4L31_02760 [Candidatus Babeliales bacterium]|nr:hypothetical protein [Candidatus Babeliales bacterium]
MKRVLYSYLIMTSPFIFGSNSQELLTQSRRNIEVFFDNLSTIIENELAKGKLLIDQHEQHLDQTYNISFQDRKNYQEEIDCLREFEKKFTKGFNKNYFEVTDEDDGIFELDSSTPPLLPCACPVLIPRTQSKPNLSSLSDSRIQHTPPISQNSVCWEPPVHAIATTSLLHTPIAPRKVTRHLIIRPKTCPPCLDLKCTANLPSQALKLTINDRNM